MSMVCVMGERGMGEKEKRREDGRMGGREDGRTRGRDGVVTLKKTGHTVHKHIHSGGRMLCPHRSWAW